MAVLAHGIVGAFLHLDKCKGVLQVKSILTNRRQIIENPTDILALKGTKVLLVCSKCGRYFSITFTANGSVEVENRF